MPSAPSGTVLSLAPRLSPRAPSSAQRCAPCERELAAHVWGGPHRRLGLSVGLLHLGMGGAPFAAMLYQASGAGRTLRLRAAHALDWIKVGSKSW